MYLKNSSIFNMTADLPILALDKKQLFQLFVKRRWKEGGLKKKIKDFYSNISSQGGDRK